MNKRASERANETKLILNRKVWVNANFAAHLNFSKRVLRVYCLINLCENARRTFRVINPTIPLYEYVSDRDDLFCGERISLSLSCT